MRVADVIAALQAGLMHYGNLPDAVNFLCFDLVGCQLPEAIKRFQAFAAEASAGGAGAPFADNHPDDADDEPV